MIFYYCQERERHSVVWVGRENLPKLFEKFNRSNLLTSYKNKREIKMLIPPIECGGRCDNKKPDQKSERPTPATFSEILKKEIDKIKNK